MLASLAASMQVGTWAKLDAPGQNASLGVGSVSGTMLHYCNSMPWNPVAKAVEIIGMDHYYTSLRHVRYVDSSNQFVLVADNDAKPDRDTNAGVEAARKAALAVDARLAVPTGPGDANDLFCAEGAEAVAAIVQRAAKIPTQPPTYPAPVMTSDEARAVLSDDISRFMVAVPEYWAAVEASREAPEDGAENRYLLDFNIVEPTATPPLLGLPVDVGLGKTSSARSAIAQLIASGGLGDRKVVYAVPRHDLGAEQVAAFEALGLRAVLWKGRTAPDPAPENPDRLMCLDSEATFDALEIEHPVEIEGRRHRAADLRERLGPRPVPLRLREQRLRLAEEPRVLDRGPDLQPDASQQG